MVDTINRKSKVPYYQQLYDILSDKIQRGQWEPGDRLPPEMELLTAYNVSRNTVRDVLDKLLSEGKIYRERGRGTFVAKPTIEQGLVRIMNFTQDMRSRGLKPSSRVLAADLVPAPAEIAERLNVPLGEELAILKRLRLADDEPMSIEEAFFAHRYCPGVLTRHDYAKSSLREMMAQDYGIRWLYAKQMIRAIKAAPDAATLLNIQSYPVILHIERVSYTESDVPLEFLRISYRGDRYSLSNELRA